jgi:CRP-like cAMP-binding protein
MPDTLTADALVESVDARIAELEQQRAVIDEEISRLQAMRQAAGAPSRTRARRTSARRASTTTRRTRRASARAATATAATTTRRRRGGGRGQSTEERLKQFKELLASGPKTRQEIAQALGVSPPRVEQIGSVLVERGEVRKERDPNSTRNRMIWTLSNN